jgi:serine/threonine-protein kinase
MGSVYEAVDTDTGETVAVKVLAAHLADDLGLQARFRAEIDTLKELRHPGIVQLLAFGEDDDQPYFAMELVRGMTVEQMIRSGKRFTWRETVATAIAVTKALKVAHDHGIVHRDLKPSNLLVPGGDAIGAGVKLADFGIAKLFGRVAHTAQGSIVGTAEYMAPEQAAGQGVDHRADLYALGLVMYAMLVGRPPFRGGQATEVIEKQRRTPAPRVSMTVPGVPPELDTLIDRLLAKDPAARPASALALTRLLTAIEQHVPDGDPGNDKLVIVDLPGSGLTGADGNFAPGDRTTFVDLSRSPAAQQSPGKEETSALPPARQGPPTAAGDGVTPHDATSPPRTPAEARFGTGQRPTAEDHPVPAKGATAENAVDVTRDSAPQTGATTRVGTGVHSRHTTIADLERVDRQRRAETETRQAWWQGALAVALMATVFGGGWLLVRPPTADALYERIKSVSRDDEADLRDADDSIGRFLARFPDDPRAGEVRGFQRRIALDRLERRSRHKIRSGRLLTPIERDYRAAMAREQESPSACVEALQAIVSLHPHPDAETGDDAEEVVLWIELTRRQLARLAPLAEEERAQDLRRIDGILATADSLHAEAAATDDPQRRAASLKGWQRLLRSIIDTYSSRPHARPAIRSVESLLEDHAAEVPGTADDSAAPTPLPPDVPAAGAESR